MLFRLLYISTVRPGHDAATIDAILAIARTRNRQNKLTGLLVYDGRRFMQYLEGDEITVRETFARIKSDPRHFAIVTLRETFAEGRQFSDWDMAIRHSETGLEFDNQLKNVLALTQNCEPMTAAELNGFIQLRAA